MKINVSYDPGAAAAPVGFASAVSAATQFYDTTFTNNITINISFDWAPTDDGSIAENYFMGTDQSYASVTDALKATTSSPNDLSAVQSIPSQDPFSSDYLVSNAESKVLGLTGSATTGSDGDVTLSSSFAWAFNQNNRSVPGQYDAVGALEHEISEVMGRALGSDGSLSVGPLALFRDSSPGVIDTSSSYAGASFSVDGKTLSFPMGEQGGDLADWGSSVQGDSYGFSVSGTASTVSGTDLQVMSLLGYTLFDPYEYIASYPDLIKAFGDNPNAGTSHWISDGNNEGRSVTFNGLNYIASYSDLIHAIGANADEGAAHFINHGFYEGRTTTFDGLEYIASYNDLIKVFGADNNAGAAHYIEFGSIEGRTTTFDGLDYIAQYTDLMKALGANNDAGAAHYIDFGFSEGRSTGLNVADYESSHPDLVGKYASKDQFLTAYINTYHNTGSFLT